MGQHVEIFLGKFVDQCSVILHQLSTVFGHPDPDHPSFQRRVILGAEELYVLGGLRLLQSRVLDGETEVRRGFVFLLPADTVVNLIHVERRQANQVARCACLLLRPIVEAGRAENEMVPLPTLLAIGFQIQWSLDLDN